MHKREDTLKNTTAFLQELASEENRSKGLSLESRDGYINRLRQLKYSKRRRPKSKPTKAAGGFGEPAKDIVNAIRKSQRSTGGRPADERRYSIAKRELSGLSYGVEANRAIVKRWVVHQTLKIRSLGFNMVYLVTAPFLRVQNKVPPGRLGCQCIPLGFLLSREQRDISERVALVTDALGGTMVC